MGKLWRRVRSSDLWGKRQRSVGIRVGIAMGLGGGKAGTGIGKGVGVEVGVGKSIALTAPLELLMAVKLFGAVQPRTEMAKS